MKALKYTKFTTLILAAFSFLCALVMKLSDSDYNFFLPACIGGFFIGLYIAVSGAESLKEHQKGIAIFQLAAAVVCIVLCIFTLIKLL